MLCLSDDRLLHLNQHLTQSIENIVQNFPQVPKKRTKQVVDQITFQIKSLIDISLESERERYIQQIQYELEKVTEERDQLFSELSDYKQKMKRDNDFLCSQNIEYMQKTTELERELRSTKWHKVQRHSYLKDVISEKETNIVELRKVLGSTRQYHQDISSGVQSIQALLRKNNIKMHKMMQQAKYCINEVHKQNLEYQASIARAKERARNEILVNKMRETQEENAKLKHVISMILDTVLGTAPKTVKKPNIDATNIIDNIPSFRNYLVNCSQVQKQEATDEIKRNLMLAIPNLTFDKDGEADVIPEIVNYIQKKHSNESKQEDEIMRLKAKIEMMKSKLNNTLGELEQTKVEKSQRKKYLSMISTNDTPINDNDDWEAKRRQLDDTIMKLSKYTTPPTKGRIPEH